MLEIFYPSLYRMKDTRQILVEYKHVVGLAIASIVIKWYNYYYIEFNIGVL